MRKGKKQPRKKSDSGLTLIELLAAIVILVFGAIAALSILVEAHKSNRMARAKTMAVNAAEEELENIFRLSPSGVMAENDRWYPIPNSNLVGPGPNGEPLHVTVTQEANKPDEITVDVTWRGQGTLPAGTVKISALRSELIRN